MPTAPRTPAEIIEALGGFSELALTLNTTRQVVNWWTITGIPPKYHEAIQALLEAKGLPRAPLEAFPRMLPPPILTDEGRAA